MIVWIGLGLALAALAISFAAYYIVFYSPHRGQNDEKNLPAGDQYESRTGAMLALIDALLALPCETVSIPSSDGLRLSARYYPGREGAGVAICFHGYRATARRDFSGGARYLIDRGFHVLLVDQRAQGRSGGHTMTFGIRERYDCLDWARYAAERFGADTPIALYGISMGAATVLMAAGLDLPENVRCVVADSPYSSPKEIICSVCRRLGLPPALLWPFIDLGARLFGHFRPDEMTAADAVKAARVPVLILHGEEDRYVPCEMSAAIAGANGAIVERHTFPAAGHGISFLVDPERYKTLLTRFLKEKAQVL